MTKKMYRFEQVNFHEMVAKMEKIAREKTGISFGFSFELASDGNLDLYVMKSDFTSDDVVRMINAGWLEKEVFDGWQEGEDPFRYDPDCLAQSHMLFGFMLEKAYGEGSEVVGVVAGGMGEDVVLNIAIPA